MQESGLNPQPQQPQQPQSAAASNIGQELEQMREAQQAAKRPQGEKLELLKREDVRTMAKDVALLRAQQAQVAQVRIESTPMNAPQPAAVEQMADTLLAGDHRQPDAQTTPLPIPQSGFRKFAIRFLIILVALFVIANLAIIVLWLASQ